MNNFKQGNFYYHKKPNGRYIQVHYSEVVPTQITEVSESAAYHTSIGADNIEITEKEFKTIFAKSISDIVGFEIEQFKEDELHLSN